MTLKDLLLAVRDENLSKEQIEKYRDAMTHMHSDMQLEMADVEKAEAIYFHDNMKNDIPVSDISIKRDWRASEKGQRQILLNRYIKTIVKEIDSLKSRVFSLL